MASSLHPFTHYISWDLEGRGRLLFWKYKKKRAGFLSKMRGLDRILLKSCFLLKIDQGKEKRWG
jgi:hypothetical protein